jgi:hypothetical protein
VDPDWKGTLPPGLTQVMQMPTNTTWLAARLLTTGSPDDIVEVDALRKFLLLMRMDWPTEELFRKIDPWAPPAGQGVEESRS